MDFGLGGEIHMSTGYLTGLTDKEVRKIEYYAPVKTRIPEDKIGRLGMLNCKTVKDVYEVYDELEGRNKEVWEENKEMANRVLHEEVRKLSKHLMSRMVRASKEQEKDLRELIKIVLDYQEKVEEQVEENKNKIESKSSYQGYRLFQGWSDEEIEHFWNGDMDKK